MMLLAMNKSVFWDSKKYRIKMGNCALIYKAKKGMDENYG